MVDFLFCNHFITSILLIQWKRFEKKNTTFLIVLIPYIIVNTVNKTKNFFSNLIMNKNIKFTGIIHNAKRSFHQYGFTDKQIDHCESNYNGKDIHSKSS
jgi:hypothetical protein